MEILNYPLGYKKSKTWDVIVSVVLIILILFLSSLLLLRVFFKDYQVSQTSMTPTVCDGDYVLVDKKAEIKRGEVIIINRKNQDPIIKRLIATGGDEIFIESGNVFVKRSGQSEFKLLDEPYVKFTKTESYPQTKIEQGKIFVLGDNRAGSYDSRAFGCLNYDDIVGVVPEWVIKNVHTKKYKLLINLYTFNFLKKIFR